MTNCCAYKCRQNGTHTFPKDPALKRKWENAIRIKNFKSKKHSRLCSKHFKDTDYVTISKTTAFPLTKKILKKSAVPSVFDYIKEKKAKKGSSERKARLERKNEQKYIEIELLPLNFVSVKDEIKDEIEEFSDASNDSIITPTSIKQEVKIEVDLLETPSMEMSNSW